MNNLTKVTMAMLCTLLIACSTHEIDYTLDEQLQSRTSDKISVSYLAQDGIPITVNCTKVAIEYSATNTTTVLILTKTDSSQTTAEADSATIAVAAGYELDLVVDGGTAFSASDLSTEVCDNVICYSNAANTLIGTGLEIIIDEMPEGL